MLSYKIPAGSHCRRTAVVDTTSPWLSSLVRSSLQNPGISYADSGSKNQADEERTWKNSHL